jgi:cupin fold WbuC family metalloprotein
VHDVEGPEDHDFVGAHGSNPKRGAPRREADEGRDHERAADSLTAEVDRGNYARDHSTTKGGSAMSRSPRTLADISRQTSADVYHANQWGLDWGADVITELKDAAGRSARSRARLCLHPSPGDRHQEMLIVMSRNAIERPQRRTIGFDTKIVLEGRAVLRYFTPDGGSTTRSVELGGEHALYVHTRSDEYHSLSISSDWFVFLEVLEGPFDATTTEFAPWSSEHEEQQE